MSVAGWLKSPMMVIVGTQLIFTIGDLMARANMRKHGFTLAAFLAAPAFTVMSVAK